MENLIPLFIALPGAAVVLQACVLLALYLSVRKTSACMEGLATEVRAKALPALESAQSILVDLRPRLQMIAENLHETTTTIRAEVQRMDAIVNDAADRARLQIIRADDTLTRPLHQVEEGAA